MRTGAEQTLPTRRRWRLPNAIVSIGGLDFGSQVQPIARWLVHNPAHLCIMPPMRQIPLNLLTLYADLAQRVGTDEVRPASISRRLVGGQRRIYAVLPGTVRQQVYLGTAGDPVAEAKAAAYRRAADIARANRATVALLKRAGIPGPDASTGRVLAALAGAGLFEAGLVLVGTAAFQLYPVVIGCHLSSSALMTQDIDISVVRFAAPRAVDGEPLEAVLKRADPAFEGVMARTDTLPKKFRSSTTKLEVDVVTTAGRSTAPVLLRSLGCSAEPLAFMDYLIGDAINVVALYGPGVRVRVPVPERFAVHKLIVSQLRAERSPKRAKDIVQAAEIIAAMRSREPDVIDEAIGEARARGPKWRKLIDTGLARVEALGDR